MLHRQGFRNLGTLFLALLLIVSLSACGSEDSGNTAVDGDSDTIDTEDGDRDSDGDSDAISTEDGDSDSDGDSDAISTEDGDRDSDGDSDAISTEDGDRDSDGDSDAISTEDGDSDSDGDSDAISTEDGDRDSDADNDAISTEDGDNDSDADSDAISTEDGDRDSDGDSDAISTEDGDRDSDADSDAINTEDGDSDSDADSDSDGSPANCNANNGGCQQKCANVGGAALCSCESGYTLAADGHTCADIDECTAGTSGCAKFCTNTIGGYTCSCESGYTLALDGIHCEDINECDHTSVCAQTCTNTAGGYTCSCRSGYTLAADGHICADIDECTAGTSGCAKFCTNTIGGYTCSCDTEAGYLLGLDAKSCAIRPVALPVDAWGYEDTAIVFILGCTVSTCTGRQVEYLVDSFDGQGGALYQYNSALAASNAPGSGDTPITTFPIAITDANQRMIYLPPTNYNSAKPPLTPATIQPSLAYHVREVGHTDADLAYSSSQSAVPIWVEPVNDAPTVMESTSSAGPFCWKNCSFVGDGVGTYIYAGGNDVEKNELHVLIVSNTCDALGTLKTNAGVAATAGTLIDGFTSGQLGSAFHFIPLSETTASCAIVYRVTDGVATSADTFTIHLTVRSAKEECLGDGRDACYIDHACYGAGTKLDDNPCLVCDPQRNTLGFSGTAIDTPCTIANASAGCNGAGSCAIKSCNSGYALSTAHRDPACSPAWTQLALGSAHTCGLTAQGDVYCWGWGGEGELGSGQTNAYYTSSVPAQVSGFNGETVLSICAGTHHNCARMSGGGVKCWGSNDHGQIGNGTNGTILYAATSVNGLDATWPTLLTCGDTFTCALLTSGRVVCWGEGSSGQLGNGATADAAEPVTVGALDGLHVTDLQAGSAHVCVMLTSGGVKCWGDNGKLQSFISGGSYSSVPLAVSGLGSYTVASLHVGAESSCVILADGSVSCWGSNESGQLGAVGFGGILSGPTAIPALVGGSPLTSLSIGSQHGCASYESGLARCWGVNREGQLGAGSISESMLVPQAIVATDSGSADYATILVSRGGGHSCVLRTGGQALCFGRHHDGQLGSGANGFEKSPLRVATPPDGAGVVALGAKRSSLVANGSALYTAGTSPGGGVTAVFAPDAAFDGELVSDLALSADFACAIVAGGAVKCAGSVNTLGQLGDGTTNAHLKAEATLSLGGAAKALAAGDDFVCAVLEGNTVKCWGGNAYGQLGRGGIDSSPHATPQAITYFAEEQMSILSITASGHHVCVLTDEGLGVYCWGDNAYGQFGAGAADIESSPYDAAQLYTGGYPSLLATGDTFTCVASNVGLRCLGDNRHGRLGNSSDVGQSGQLVSVSGLAYASVTRLGCGEGYACALLSDGAMACWGYGLNGRLGSGLEADAPMAFGLTAPDDTTFTALYVGPDHACAQLSDGGLACWGEAAHGELGDSRRLEFPLAQPVDW